MPLYEYQCDACSHRFEVIRKYSDPPVEMCTKCGGTVKKLLSSPAFQFKGTGWYVTDYGRKGATGSTGTASSNGSGSGSTDSSSESSSTKPSTPSSDSTKSSS